MSELGPEQLNWKRVAQLRQEREAREDKRLDKLLKEKLKVERKDRVNFGIALFLGGLCMFMVEQWIGYGFIAGFLWLAWILMGVLLLPVIKRANIWLIHFSEDLERIKNEVTSINKALFELNEKLEDESS
jgi:hypothetical protein